MKKLLRIAAGVFGVLALGAPLAFAQAASISIQSLSPGTTAIAKSLVTFKIVPAGFSALSYQLSDSFGATSTASESDIDLSGNFSWVPIAIDAGTHTFTVTASDYSGNSASTTETIQVLPPPSLTIQSVSGGTSIMPGTKFSFVVSAVGFTNPAYSMSDSFSGSSVGNVSIDSSGNFSWTPDASQNGDHLITIYAYDSLGHSASISQPIRVGAGPILTIAQLSPLGASVSPGTTTSFSVVPMNFSPTSFAISDTFASSSITNGNINTSGAFSWVPLASDVGSHVLTIRGVVGAYGQSATTTQTITVLGPGGSLPPLASTSNTASSTLLSALQAQLAGLVAQVKTQSSATSSATVSSDFTFTTYLHPGIQSEEVNRLQGILAQQGFFSGTPNGYYGPHTIDAVVKFQAAHGLKQLGVVGPATRAALNKLQSTTPTPTNATATSTASDGYLFQNFIGFGKHGNDVLELQKRLATLGFFSGEPTGSFGAVTEAAVKAFQTSKGIEAKGYVGPGTRAALNQ